MGKLLTGLANLIVALVVASIAYLCYAHWDQFRPRLEQITGRKFGAVKHHHGLRPRLLAELTPVTISLS